MIFISALIGFLKCVEMILLFVISFATECSQFLGVINIIIIITDSQNVIFLMIKIKKFNGLFVGQTYCHFTVENFIKISLCHVKIMFQILFGTYRHHSHRLTIDFHQPDQSMIISDIIGTIIVFPHKIADKDVLTCMGVTHLKIRKQNIIILRFHFFFYKMFKIHDTPTVCSRRSLHSRLLMGHRKSRTSHLFHRNCQFLPTDR